MWYIGFFLCSGKTKINNLFIHTFFLEAMIVKKRANYRQTPLPRYCPPKTPKGSKHKEFTQRQVKSLWWKFSPISNVNGLYAAGWHRCITKWHPWCCLWLDPRECSNNCSLVVKNLSSRQFHFCFRCFMFAILCSLVQFHIEWESFDKYWGKQFFVFLWEEVVLNEPILSRNQPYRESWNRYSQCWFLPKNQFQ